MIDSNKQLFEWITDIFFNRSYSYFSRSFVVSMIILILIFQYIYDLFLMFQKT